MEALYPDIPRIYTAIAEWTACMIYITLLEKRIRGFQLAGSCIGFFAAQCILLHSTRNVPTVMWIPCMLMAVAFMFGCLYGNCKITRKATVYFYQGSPFSSRFIADIYNIRTLVDLGGLAILYAYQSRVSELYAERELNAINTMFKSQYEQYRYYQESVEMINIKYHDLKHQIAGLRGIEDSGKRSNWLDVMDEEVNQYQALSRTGNQVLDTILSIKQWYCKKQDISLTCVADGEILNAIHVMDLCSIFGNALDNAIESVVSLEQMEQRLIHLSVSRQKSFIFILIENYCENDVELADGLPLTTKADKKGHGFGMKSMRYSVEKYGGNLSVAVQDNWFKLRILIPHN